MHRSFSKKWSKRPTTSNNKHKHKRKYSSSLGNKRLRNIPHRSSPSRQHSSDTTLITQPSLYRPPELLNRSDDDGNPLNNPLPSLPTTSPPTTTRFNPNTRPSQPHSLTQPNTHRPKRKIIITLPRRKIVTNAAIAPSSNDTTLHPTPLKCAGQQISLPSYQTIQSWAEEFTTTRTKFIVDSMATVLPPAHENVHIFMADNSASYADYINWYTTSLSTTPTAVEFYDASYEHRAALPTPLLPERDDDDNGEKSTPKKSNKNNTQKNKNTQTLSKKNVPNIQLRPHFHQYWNYKQPPLLPYTQQFTHKGKYTFNYPPTTSKLVLKTVPYSITENHPQYHPSYPTIRDNNITLPYFSIPQIIIGEYFSPTADKIPVPVIDMDFQTFTNPSEWDKIVIKPQKDIDPLPSLNGIKQFIYAEKKNFTPIDGIITQRQADWNLEKLQFYIDSASPGNIPPKHAFTHEHEHILYPSTENVPGFVDSDKDDRTNKINSNQNNVSKNLKTTTTNLSFIDDNNLSLSSNSKIYQDPTQKMIKILPADATPDQYPTFPHLPFQPTSSFHNNKPNETIKIATITKPRQQHHHHHHHHHHHQQQQQQQQQPNQQQNEHQSHTSQALHSTSPQLSPQTSPRLNPNPNSSELGPLSSPPTQSLSSHHPLKKVSNSFHSLHHPPKEHDNEPLELPFSKQQPSTPAAAVTQQEQPTNSIPQSSSQPLHTRNQFSQRYTNSSPTHIPSLQTDIIAPPHTTPIMKKIENLFQESTTIGSINDPLLTPYDMLNPLISLDKYNESNDPYLTTDLPSPTPIDTRLEPWHNPKRSFLTSYSDIYHSTPETPTETFVRRTITRSTKHKKYNYGQFRTEILPQMFKNQAYSPLLSSSNDDLLSTTMNYPLERVQKMTIHREDVDLLHTAQYPPAYQNLFSPLGQQYEPINPRPATTLVPSDLITTSILKILEQQTIQNDFIPQQLLDFLGPEHHSNDIVNHYDKIREIYKSNSSTHLNNFIDKKSNNKNSISKASKLSTQLDPDLLFKYSLPFRMSNSQHPYPPSRSGHIFQQLREFKYQHFNPLLLDFDLSTPNIPQSTRNYNHQISNIQQLEVYTFSNTTNRHDPYLQYGWFNSILKKIKFSETIMEKYSPLPLSTFNLVSTHFTPRNVRNGHLDRWFAMGGGRQGQGQQGGGGGDGTTTNQVYNKDQRLTMLKRLTTDQLPYPRYLQYQNSQNDLGPGAIDSSDNFLTVNDFCRSHLHDGIIHGALVHPKTKDLITTFTATYSNPYDPRFMGYSGLTSQLMLYEMIRGGFGYQQPRHYYSSPPSLLSSLSPAHILSGSSSPTLQGLNQWFQERFGESKMGSDVINQLYPKLPLVYQEAFYNPTPM